MDTSRHQLRGVFYISSVTRLTDCFSIDVFADQGLLACHLLVIPGKPFDQIEIAGAARVLT